VSSVVKYKFPFSKEVCRNKLKSHYFAHFSAEMNEILSYYKVEKHKNICHLQRNACNTLVNK